MTPRLSYAICTTPRSGSWMLCSLLAQTGVAGKPSEYFGPTLIEEIRANRADAHALSTGAFLSAAVAASTGGNGVCGTKLLAKVAPVFMLRASEQYGKPFPSFRQALECTFPNLHYILLTRENKVAQAISFYRGIITQVWQRAARSTEPMPEVAYDVYGIQCCYQEILLSDAYWEGFFAVHEIEPLRLTYEALVGDFVGETRRALHYLGLPEDTPIKPPQTRKLADEQSKVWEEAFRSRGPLPELPPLAPDALWGPY